MVHSQQLFTAKTNPAFSCSPALFEIGIHRFISNGNGFLTFCFSIAPCACCLERAWQTNRRQTVRRVCHSDFLHIHWIFDSESFWTGSVFTTVHASVYASAEYRKSARAPLLDGETSVVSATETRRRRTRQHAFTHEMFFQQMHKYQSEQTASVVSQVSDQRDNVSTERVSSTAPCNCTCVCVCVPRFADANSGSS